jgi:sec-independent protein translocase protein TatA
VTTITCCERGFFLATIPVCPETGYATPMPNIGTGEIILLLLLALLLFGAKRLPEIGRSLGTGMKEFKDSVTGKTPVEPTELPPAAETRERETV